MMIKVYVSGISGNVLMKLQQDHIERILAIKGIQYQAIDIADPNHASDKSFMWEKLKLPEQDDDVPLPPQIFNETEYCGDYDTFFTAVERELLYSYLQLQAPPSEIEFQRNQTPKLETEL